VAEVAQRAGLSRPTVWRWQRRYGEAGVEGLLRDKTRPAGKAAAAGRSGVKVLALTCCEPPGKATHRTGRAMARKVGISLCAVDQAARSVRTRAPTCMAAELYRAAVPPFIGGTLAQLMSRSRKRSIIQRVAGPGGRAEWWSTKSGRATTG
jgi:hypothetical protein